MLCVLVALSLLAPPGIHADSPSVDQIVDRYITAIGGRDKDAEHRP